MKMGKRCTDIPNPHAPDSLAVTDGTTSIGRIVARDGSYFAFGTDNILLGEFATQGQAMHALPAASARDLYPTPAWCTLALLEHIDIAGKRVSEPAAGELKSPRATAMTMFDEVLHGFRAAQVGILSTPSGGIEPGISGKA